MDSLIKKNPFLDYYGATFIKYKKILPENRCGFENLYRNMPDFGKGIIELMGLTFMPLKISRPPKVIPFAIPVISIFPLKLY